jgi:hypothetical protein
MSGDELSREEVEPLVWEVKMWHRGTDRRFVILVAALFAGLLGLLLLNNVLFAIIGFVAIMGATTEYWLPTRYKLDGNGASLRCGISVTSIDWSAVKRIVETDEGVKLSPLEQPSKLSTFRGVYLRYADNKEEVLEKIRKLRGEDV